MSESIERIENLIRVVSNVPDDKFDICRWYNPSSGCGCAVGHAMRDNYFVANGFDLVWGREDVMDQVGAYFGLTGRQARSLFINQVGYGSRRDVLGALRVVLLEKMAQEINYEVESARAPELSDA